MNIANHLLSLRFLVPSFGSVSSSLIYSYNNNILSLGIEMKLPAVVAWELMLLCGRDYELAARELYFIRSYFGQPVPD